MIPKVNVPCGGAGSVEGGDTLCRRTAPLIYDATRVTAVRRYCLKPISRNSSFVVSPPLVALKSYKALRHRYLSRQDPREYKHLVVHSSLTPVATKDTAHELARHVSHQATCPTIQCKETITMIADNLNWEAQLSTRITLFTPKRYVAIHIARHQRRKET